MKIIKSIAALMLLAASLVTVAQDKPSLFASRTTTMQAVVEEIDYEARLVTLRREDGSSITITPSPDVHNLEEVSVGDILHVEYSQSVSIKVADVDGVEPVAGEVSAITRSEEGEMPAMAAIETVVIIAKVVAIDLETATYKLEMPGGMINEYAALNPANLELAAIGDMVAIEITETAVAVVEKVTPTE